MSLTHRLFAIAVTLLLFGFVSYIASAFLSMLPMTYEQCGSVPGITTFEILRRTVTISGRSAMAVYPQALINPSFLAAGLGVVIGGVRRGKPPFESALLPWLAVMLLVIFFSLSSLETTPEAIIEYWPFILADAVIASLCWALARVFW